MIEAHRGRRGNFELLAAFREAQQDSGFWVGKQVVGKALSLFYEAGKHNVDLGSHPSFQQGLHVWTWFIADVK